ncbi:cytochrome P450 [Salisediminibacterium selenitireducens]|uniref:Cytochrome P450 n=1 Tax=Bacillus selenitireducens (strain ATCC 700615 / DSM 15326 / MLS10) TaxID=439292 RepID=D6XYV3_BACIE|nr:cytochrome P450 [Salisediminibacterium selenitireducens]ADH98261.1 cytochrome P450 [[Bacillus] selenitireducens MLS10]
MAGKSFKFPARLRSYLYFRKDPIGFFMNMQGDGDIVFLDTGVMPTYVVNGASYLQEILVTKDASFRKGRPSNVLKRTIGDGLLTTEKTAHKIQKSGMQPVFYKDRLKRYAEVMVSDAKETVRGLHDDKEIRMDDEMMALTLSVISKVMFATDAGTRKKKLADAVNVTIHQSARNLFSPVLLPMSVPTKGNRDHSKAIRVLEEEVHAILKEARRNPDAYKETMIGLLMDAKALDEQGLITDQELRDQMMTMLLAGHETSANLLTWIFYLLAEHPDVARKLQEEVDQVDLTEDPFAATRSLPYTHQVIKETLRLYPPAWLIYREADEDVELSGKTYKEGTVFMMSTYAIHRNPDVFDDPEAFRPDRFAGDQEKNLPPFTYIPFGAGSRSCIGYRFAMMETALILAVIAKSYHFERAGTETIKGDPLISLRVKDGLRMIAKERKQTKIPEKSS